VRRRLALLALAITSLVVVAFTVPLMLVVVRQAAERAQINAERQTQTVASLVALAMGLENLTASALEDRLGGIPEGIGLIMPDGEVLGEVPASSRLASSVRLGVPGSGSTIEGWEVALPVYTREGVIGVIGSVPRAELRRGVATAVTLLGGLGVLVILAAVGVADRLGRSLVRPVDELAGVARRLSEGDLDARAIIGGPPEVQAVGRSLNDLAERLGELIAAERESLADLSHRLRTPLAGLRLAAERLEGKEGEDLLPAIERMQGAIDDMIVSVRQGPPPARLSDLAEVVGRRLDFWRVLAREQGRSLTALLDPGPLLVRAGEDEVGSVLDGLLGNVLAHTERGAPMEVILERVGTGTARLTVGDGGRGFPAGFDPLRRGVSGAGSTGLGLDIARRLAERLGGTVKLGRSPLGGAQVEVIVGTAGSPSPPGGG
jgi:signal transduction histidine kinase